MYSVTANSPLRNESHVCVGKSNIQGAGNVLFLCACPPRQKAAEDDSDKMSLSKVTHTCVSTPMRGSPGKSIPICPTQIM